MNLSLEPKILRWARERAGLDEATLAKKLGYKKVERVTAWEQTGELPYEKAELLAEKTHTPFGYLFLKEPPEDRLPIPDFRTPGDRPIPKPSPALLETVHQMERRQAWMREFLIEEGEQPLSFIGSLSLQADPREAGQAMRRELGCADGWAASERTWTDALMQLRRRGEEREILVVFNGVVGNNTHWALDRDEFRGFALVDEYAPLVFVNAADFKAAQMFTFAHELAHLWIAKSGVSNVELAEPPTLEVEKWCNQTAAEFLIPGNEMVEVWRKATQREEPFQFLAGYFKVSSLVAARRALDLGMVERAQFFRFYENYVRDERRKKEAKESGGDFWRTQNLRVGQRFGSAVVQAAREGRLLYREAFELTGLSGPTFDRFAEKLGFSKG